MKVLGGVSHAETQWDNIEKARFVSLYALAPEVVSSVKDQLELALGKGLTFKYRGIATAIIISGDFFQQARFNGYFRMARDPLHGNCPRGVHKASAEIS